MRAILVIVVLCVIGYFWMNRTPTPPVQARPPAIERPVSSLDPKTALDRAKVVTDKVQKDRDKSGEYGRK